MTGYFGHARPDGLERVLRSAVPLPIDDRSRIILFSDTHRGDKSATDPFVPNEELFLYVLTRYYRRGFTYIELGDGDDLWQAPHFGVIQQAYPRIFELLGQFHRDGRLHLIVGNHELARGADQPPAKGDLVSVESLALRYRATGRTWLVAHGHQADPWCDPVNKISWRIGQVVYDVLNLLRSGSRMGHLARLAPVNQALVRCLERWYQRWDQQQQQKLTRCLATWAQWRRQALICGHTHLPFFPPSPRIPYFNTGCGIYPGYITGLEIQNGWIGPVKWWTDGRGKYQRSRPAAVRPLGLF